MTKLHQNLLTLATLLVPILLVAPAFAQELLTNPGFEEIADNGIPTGWGRHAGGVPESVLQVVDDAHSGQHAVRLIDTGPQERESKYSIGVVQTVKAEGGKFYKGSVWVKALARNNQGALNIQIRFLPGNKLHQVQLKPPIGGDWKQRSVIGEAPQGTTHVRMYIYTMHYWTSDSLIDDASLTALDIATGTILGPLLSKGSSGIEKVRRLNLRTAIVLDGQPAAKILVPAGELYRALGEKLAQAIEAKSGARLPVTDEYQGTVESPETIIALGNLNNNRMVERLYFNKYLQIDALKPGPGNYVLQTVHEPYNGPLGKNVIVIGASDDEGLAAGVDDFASRIEQGPDLVLEEPLLYVSGCKPMNDEARNKLLAQAPTIHALRVFWMATQQYRDTGDLAYAERAKQVLLYCGERFVENPGYRVTWPEETSSNMIGAMWDVLEEAPVFTDQERLECTNIVLMALHELPRHTSGYSGLESNTTIIWNHTTFPLMGIYWLSRYFHRYYGDVDAQMELMLEKVAACFEGQITSWKPQEDSLGYYSIVPRHTIEYTLAENDYRYFENGSVRKHADYTIGICDNTGDAGGFGDSGYGHGPYVRNIHWALWYYKDGRYLWWLNKVLERGYQNPYDQTIEPVEWPELAGVTVYELHPQVYEYTKDKSYYGGPISPPNVPLEKAFDKISFREGLDANGEYFLLDGYARGKHLQYDGNAIIKYYADGEDWLIDGDYLVRNTTDHNMISIIRDGRCETLVPTCTALEAIGDLPTAGFTQTKVYDYNGADWTRSIFWLKGEFTVVMDELEAIEPGNFTFVGNWKTLAEGEQELADSRIFKTSRTAGGGVGSRSLVIIAKPAEGVEKAVKFNDPYSRLDTAIQLSAGKYAITTYASGTSTGSDSLYLRVGGDGRVALHTPINRFGPSSSTPTKDTPTPNIEVKDDGLHRFTFTLREGPGIMLDRFVIQDLEGEVVAEIQAEDAPPLPQDELKDAGTSDFYVKNDGFSQNSLAGRINHVGRKITYLRQRFGGNMKTGDKVTLANIFYNDTSGAPKDYDIRKLDPSSVLILKDGKPFAAFGVGEHVAGPATPDNNMGVTMRDRCHAVGLTAFEGLFSADRPVAVEINFASATATLLAPVDAKITKPDGSALELNDGFAIIDCKQWTDLAMLREELPAVFDEAMEQVMTPPAAGQEMLAAPREMEPTWSTPIALEQGDDPQPIFTIYPVDLDDDGNQELIVLRGKWATCLDAAGKVLWRFPTGGKNRAVCAADLDGDGLREVLVGSDDEHIYVLNSKGEQINEHHANWPLRVGRSSVRQPKLSNLAVGDLDADGNLDIIAAMLNGNLVRYDTDFNKQWRYDSIPHGTREMTLVDLDRDGVQEIVTANKYGHVEIFNADGKRAGMVYSELGDVEMAIGNMDEDDDYEIANGSATGSFTLQQFGGSEKLHFHNYGFACREAIMADVAGDDCDELLVGSETGYMYVLNAQAEVIAQINFREVVTDLALVSGDEKPLIAASLGSGGVYLLSGAAEPLARWQADGEVVMVEALRTGDGARLLAATADAVTCLTP